MPRVAIIAAMQREVRGAIRKWRVNEREHAGRRFTFYENNQAVLVCGGIGPEAARRACEAVIALYQPAMVISAGFAGGLDSELKVGDSFTPRQIIDASDGSTIETGKGNGVLLSFGSVAGVEQKKKLAQSYGAQAIDMEAAAIARGAQARGVPFMAYKAISDEVDFEFPPLDKFITSDGTFCTGRFVRFAAVRPWIWGRTLRMAANAAKAEQTLSAWLDQYNRPMRNSDVGEPELRRITNSLSSATK